MKEMEVKQFFLASYLHAHLWLAVGFVPRVRVIATGL